MTRLGDFIDRLSTCPECRCGLEGGWRKDCGCTRYDCECSETAGPDTDGEDTFDYRRPDAPAEPAKGKWWLGGRCSVFCGDAECPPCQQEELAKADQLPPASLPWLNGPPPPLADEDRAMPEADDKRKSFTPDGIPVYHCDDPACGCEKPGRWWTREAREGRRDQRRETWREIKQAWGGESTDVKVHHTQGCGLCGSRDEHTHTQSDWRALIDSVGDRSTDWRALIDSVGDRSTDRLNPPPTAQPYRSKRQSAAPTTSTSGAAAMSSAVSYGSLKARILQIGTNLTDAQGPLQQLVQCVEDQIAELAATSEDSNHAGIQEALGNLMNARESIEQAGWMIGAAQASTEGAAAELS